MSQPLTGSDLAELAVLAGRMADAASLVTQRYFRAPVTIEAKSDSSPVTEADREAESAMREILRIECPEHGIYGEEHGQTGTDGEFVWVLDPIDGTKSFVIGKPLFGTLIALAHNGKPVLGVIDCPILGERWVGLDGLSTTLNKKAVSTRFCGRLADAWLASTAPDMFEVKDQENFDKLRGDVRHTVWGGDCHSYGLLAAGTLDLVVEATMKPYDFMALVPIVNGAGGKITDWEGNPLGFGSDGRVLAAGDPRLHETVLKILGG